MVGPRNEAELLLLSSYGFDAAKLTAIDLFSYTPVVRLMDMHELKYSDNSFDAVYSAFVITYSDDIPRAVGGNHPGCQGRCPDRICLRTSCRKAPATDSAKTISATGPAIC